MNDGRRLQRQDRQAVADEEAGPQGAVQEPGAP